MTKQEYLNKIREGISGIPKNDVEERIAFYSKIINDKIEEGLSEYGAILEIGAADDVVQQILLEYPLSKLVKEKVSSIRKMKTSETVLLILSSISNFKALVHVCNLFSMFQSVPTTFSK